MKEDFAVSFESPSAGWLPLHISAGDVEVTLDVSYTPNDFLRELIGALLSVAAIEGTFAVAVNEEPEVSHIAFARTVGQARVVVTRQRPEKTLLDFSGSPSTVVISFWRALRRLQHDPRLHEWCLPFPEREMRDLTERVERLKSTAA